MSKLQAADRGLTLRTTPGEVSGDGPEQQPHRQPQVGHGRRVGRKRTSTEPLFSLLNRLATNNMSKSESDQEDNDDLNDNDWSYGAEKKGPFITF